MRKAVAALVLLAAGGASAADIDLTVDNFWQDGKITSAVLKVSNHLDRPVTDIRIDCAFLDENKKAIDIGLETISQVEAQSYAYGKASIVTGRKVSFAECRVVGTD